MPHQIYKQHFQTIHFPLVTHNPYCFNRSYMQMQYYIIEIIELKNGGDEQEIKK